MTLLTRSEEHALITFTLTITGLNLTVQHTAGRERKNLMSSDGYMKKEGRVMRKHEEKETWRKKNTKKERGEETVDTKLKYVHVGPSNSVKYRLNYCYECLCHLFLEFKL